MLIFINSYPFFVFVSNPPWYCLNQRWWLNGDSRAISIRTFYFKKCIFASKPNEKSSESECSSLKYGSSYRIRAEAIFLREDSTLVHVKYISSNKELLISGILIESRFPSLNISAKLSAPGATAICDCTKHIILLRLTARAIVWQRSARIRTRNTCIYTSTYRLSTCQNGTVIHHFCVCKSHHEYNIIKCCTIILPLSKRL